ncbi:OmpA family protein [Paraflavisolibacter sp. H34]|uniref:OmpA family protein n=1 Tax=Huijunlia imazamoxiresistens TaxID=3127457 RepID=UPI0030198A85
MNGTYNFPAKPRNQWEVGVKAGAFTVSSDVSAIFPTLGLGAHVRKSFGYVFSARLEYMYGVGKGMNYLSAVNYGKNTALNGNTNADLGGPGANYNTFLFSQGGTPVAPIYTRSAAQPVEKVFYNYKTQVHDLALEGIITLNNIRFHKAKTGLNIYGIAGIGATIYETKVNALGSDGNRYNYNSIDPTLETWKNRKEVRDQIKALPNWDDSYETAAEKQGPRRPKLFGMTFKPVGHVGAGVAYKLNNRFNIALEDRFTITKDDLLDGQRWQENQQGAPSLTRDYDAYNFASIGINYNIGAKATEPLYWLNPLDYAYSEIRNPRLMRLPKPVLPDADGDGVTDQFDQEQTPQGCPVDTHGVSRDTDGDGVPDCRDKELVTPTYCQPVDADGVGKCPCPEGCGVDTTANACATKLGALPSVTFAGNSITLSSDNRSLLASIASRMRNNPECKVVVIGYCASSKSEQQRSWDRVNSVINYLVEKEGVSADRFIFQYGQEGGDCNTVDLRAAASNEEGPTNVPAPHPNLRRR